MATAITNIKHDGEWFDADSDVSDLPDDILASLAEQGAVELTDEEMEEIVGEDEGSGTEAGEGDAAGDDAEAEEGQG